jgi:cupin 2 domain-containing protein
VSRPRSLYAGIPAHLSEELLDVLVAAPGARVERIVSRGHASPAGSWYDQDSDEFVLLVRGRAGLRLEGEGEPTVLEPGDHLTIPAHARHRVEWTDPDGDTVWLAVHLGSSVEGDLEAGGCAPPPSEGGQ